MPSDAADGLTLPANRQLRRRPLVLGVAGLMFVAIFVLRLLVENPDQTVTPLFVVPIALVAIELGMAWGLAAGALALGLFAVWGVALAQSPNYTALDYLARGAPFLVLGGMVGALADRVRRNSAERARFWELSTDLLCTAGFDGYFKLLSPAWEKTLGWTSEELRARPFLEFVHPEDRERTQAEAERLTGRGEETLTFANRYLCKDGSYRHLLWGSKAIPQEQLMYAVAKDVTERAEAEERMRRSEGFLDSVLENIPDMVFVKEAEELRFVRLNRAGEKLLGYPREEMIGKNDHDIFPQEDADSFARKDREVLASHEVLDIPEEPIETQENGSRTLHTRKIAVRDEHGEPTYLVGISEDITERRLVEQRFRGLLEAAPDAMVVADRAGTIMLINTQTEKLLGYEREELIGAPVELLVPESLRERHTKHRDSYLRDPKNRSMGSDLALFARRKDGSKVSVEISLSPVETEEGTQVIAAIRDVTAKKRIEELAETAREEAELANRAKSEFLSRMSHELRTPLNAVIGFAQLLEMDELNPDQHEGVHEILKGGRHLLELINEVLDISRIEAGTMSISMEPVHLGSVLADALSLIRPLAEEAKVKLAIDSSELEGVYVLADQQRLKQVLINLLSNAVKYNREGGNVTVSCEIPAAERVRFAVVDTGEGMGAEQLERLFSPFERLGAERTEVEGTGLGLALSKRLVEAMQGTIEAKSVLGSGTSMQVELESAQSPEIEETLPDRIDARVDSAPGERRKVLYIEDNLSNLKLVEHLLKHLPDVQLIPAMHGQLGLELARQHSPDMVLLDLHLPDLAGKDVLERLKGDPATAGIPVIVISADATAGQIERLRAAGATDYLTKPIEAKRLLELVTAIT